MRMLGMMNQFGLDCMMNVCMLIGTEWRGGLGLLYIAGCAVSPCRHVQVHGYMYVFMILCNYDYHYPDCTYCSYDTYPTSRPNIIPYT
jgi:hypothetical protein